MFFTIIEGDSFKAFSVIYVNLYIDVIIAYSLRCIKKKSYKIKIFYCNLY